jgi:transcriptional regulator
MYTPRHFKEDDPAVLRRLIEERPFATLVSHGRDGLAASHLPLMHLPMESESGPPRLLGHLAQPNPQAQELLAEPEGAQVLAIFQGAQAYISPSFYASKREHGKVVPTWNYVAVHARGRAKAFVDADRLRELVTRLTEKQERTFAQPWAVGDAPEDFTQKMLKGIVGIEIFVSSLEGQWKLSQNKSEADRRGVVEGLRSLEDGDAREVAEHIARRED